MRKGLDNKKTKKLIHEEIKKQLIESIVNDNTIETDESSKKAEEDQKPEEVATVIKQFKDIIRTKKKGITSIVYRQGKVFEKFKDKEKFIKLINQFKVHKTTIPFSINIFKLCEKYPKLLKSSIELDFLKNYYKDIKEIFNENQRSFHNYFISF